MIGIDGRAFQSEVVDMTGWHIRYFSIEPDYPLRDYTHLVLTEKRGDRQTNSGRSDGDMMIHYCWGFLNRKYVNCSALSMIVNIIMIISWESRVLLYVTDGPLIVTYSQE